MFGNEEIVRFESNQSLADLHSAVEDCLEDLGDATISKSREKHPWDYFPIHRMELP